MSDDLGRALAKIRCRRRIEQVADAWDRFERASFRLFDGLVVLVGAIFVIAGKIIQFSIGAAILGVFIYYVAAGFSKLGESFSTKRYAAEVGFYHGETIAWDLWGDFTSLDDCRSAAIGRFNYYAAQNGRGYTWSCLLKISGGGYESRHR